MAELIAFIGGGQMAGSLIGGLIAAGHPASRIRVAEPDTARATVLRREYGIEVKSAGAEVVNQVDAVVLAVKPQMMSAALKGLPLPAKAVAVSIAAGIRVESLRRLLGGKTPVIRCMPNTPALLRQGVTALYAPAETTPAARALAEKILGSVGATCWVPDEDQLDAVTALSGSGPAYYFLLTEALREAGQSLGLDAATAKLLAEKTIIGAGRMAETGKDVAELRANVTSKGGTTEAAVSFLEINGLRTLFKGALTAAAARSKQLGAELAKG